VNDLMDYGPYPDVDKELDHQSRPIRYFITLSYLNQTTFEYLM